MNHTLLPSASHLLRLSGVTSLLMMLLLLWGCNYLGLLSSMTIQRVDAVYPIEDRPTAVLVEDPQGLFLTGANARRIGAHIAFHLEQNEAVTRTVSQQAVRDLAADYGQDFESAPLDTIARELDAEQLIHVSVQEVDLSPTVGTGLYEPQARVEVKLIDAVEGRRLFPDPGVLDDPGAREPGHRVELEQPHHDSSQPGPDVQHMLARDLAEQMGWEVAKLFFEHPEADFGQRFD